MRNAILFTTALVAMNIASAQSPKPMPYTVPFEKQYRVILCMDTANEVDDALAIVHALLTPQFDVKCMIAEQFRVKKEDALLWYQSVAVR